MTLEPLGPDSVDLVASALTASADLSDVGMFVRVFSRSFAEALPEGMVEVDSDRSLGAEGIVGVQLLSLPHRWGGHTTEFFAIGTAVRPLREDHTIATPALVLPLTDQR